MTDFKSFTKKLTPPPSDPRTGVLYGMYFNLDWAPVVLGALFVLWDREAWEGDEAAILNAQTLAEQLLKYWRVNTMAGIVIAVDDANAYTVQATDGSFAFIIDTVNNQIILRTNNEGYAVLIEAYGTSAGGAVTGRSSGGSLASPTAILNNRELLRITGAGHDGVSFSSGRALMRFAANENWTTTAQGARIEFETTPLGQTTRIQAMILAANTSAPTVGFLGASPVVRQNVTGSRSGGAALANLLTALANLGLITDATSA